jgi:citronellol/citronellal dehydrogenase
MAEEFRSEKIAFNSLWPKTMIATAAVKVHLGGDETIRRSRNDLIVADAAYVILTSDAAECTGNFFVVKLLG